MSLPQLIAWMERAGVDAACVSDPLSIGYLTGFFANPPFFNERLDERRQREPLRLFGRQLREQIAGHVTEHVEAGDVHRAECSALGTSERRPRDYDEL